MHYVKYDQQFLAQEVAHGNRRDCAAATLCISWPKNVQQEAGAFDFSIFQCSWFLPVRVMSRRGFDDVVLLCHHLLCEFLQRVVLSANCSHPRWLHVFVFLLLILSSTALITAWVWVCVRVCARVCFKEVTTADAACFSATVCRVLRSSVWLLHLLSRLFRDVGATFRCSSCCRYCSWGCIFFFFSFVQLL